MMPSLVFPADLLCCVFCLPVVPVAVFFLMTFDKERYVLLHFREESAGSLMRLGVSIACVGVAGWLMLRVYLFLALIVVGSDVESWSAEPVDRFSIGYFAAGLLLYLAVSGLMAVVPEMLARRLGYRIAGWVRISLAVAVAIPYVAYVGMELVM